MRGVSLEVREGELVALVGANGAGKTTLLRTLSGVQKASGGQVRFAGQDITKLAAERRTRLGICQVPEGSQVFAAGTLSGGQQQMRAMARALMGRPRLLLLDEPSMGLAPLLVEEIFNAVINLRQQGKTIFLVEQNALAALAIADRAYVIETGNVILQGTGSELLANEQVQAAYLGM